jgi:hypothetical protein
MIGVSRVGPTVRRLAIGNRIEHNRIYGFGHCEPNDLGGIYTLWSSREQCSAGSVFMTLGARNMVATAPNVA